MPTLINTNTLGVATTSGDWIGQAMPVCPVQKCGLANIITELITIGGESDGHVRNELYTYSETQLLSKHLPAIPNAMCCDNNFCWW